MQENRKDCCGHGHAHGHSHSHGNGNDPLDEVKALLGYMESHNRQHAEELSELGEKLRGMGKAEAADKIAEAVSSFTESNGKLSEALELVKQL